MPSPAPSAVFSLRVAACALLCASLLVVGVAPAHGNPTLHRLGHTTPAATSVSRFPPLHTVGDGADIAALATGAPVARPLVAQLQLMFEAFFATAAQGSTQTVRLQVGYSYPVGPGPGPQVPVALVPPSPFAVPGDWSPDTACQGVRDESIFVCQVAAVIRQWVGSNQPAVAGAVLTFDLAATPSDSTLPLVQVSGLTLRRADVTDL